MCSGVLVLILSFVMLLGTERLKEEYRGVQILKFVGKFAFVS